MNTKKLLFTILVVALALCSFAAPRTSEQAISIAKKSVGNRVASGALKAPARPNYTIAAQSGAYYAVNTGAGFVLVSADDRMPEILGYSDNAGFVADSMPPALLYWLNEYDTESQMLDNMSAPSNAPASVTAFSDAVAPLVKTQWDQDAPFNNMAPYVSSSERAATGCVATAMAQIMKYHEWPTTGTGNHSYYWTCQENSSYSKTLSANFGNTTYNWSSMLNSYSGSYTSAQANAVATLMYHCGVAVNMQYGGSSIGGSGASSVDAMNALINYFGYDSNIRCAIKDSVSISALTQALHDEIAANRPIFVTGRDSQSGHAFICDGYNTSGYFHFNWGWSGVADGYYLLTALNPTEQGIGANMGSYNQYTTFFINIKPSDDSQNNIVASGTCGTNLTWQLTTDGVLTITGSGAMADYTSSSNTPWYDYRSQIKELALPNGITRIGSYAFGSCSSLTSVTIPSSVTSIGSSAFASCSGLKEVHISNLAAWCNISFENNTANPVYWPEKLYLNGTLITNLIIPSSVTSIGNYAFIYCKSLTSVKIPSSVTNIGNYAFSNCTALTSITNYATIPQSIVSSVFNGVNTTQCVLSVPAISVNAYMAADVWNTFSNIVYIPGSNIVASGTCGTGLSWNLDIDSVLTISGSGEMKQYSISTHSPWYNYRNNIKSVILEEGVKSISSYAFYYCSILTSVTIPNSVTSIESQAFYFCSALKSITIPKNLKPHNMAFYGCNSLSNFYVADDHLYYNSINGVLYSKDNKTLERCPGGKRGVLEIPDGVTTIDGYAFYGCISLTTISIPSSVTNEIGSLAFNWCSGLTSIVNYALTPQKMNRLHLDRVNTAECILYVPEESLDLYRAAPGWAEFTNILPIDNSTIPVSPTSISLSPSSVAMEVGGTKTLSYTVSPSNATTEITWSSSNTSVATVSASGIVSAVSEGATTITAETDNGKKATCQVTVKTPLPAGNCGATGDGSNLQWVFDPSTGKLTISGSGAMQDFEDVYDSNGNWQDCSTPWYEYHSSITSVSLPSGLTSIGQNAFSDCEAITSITIPSKVNTIGDYAFYGCTNLVSLNLPNNVTDIGTFAFVNTGLTNPLYNATLFACLPSSYSGTYTIPSGIKTIAESAFANCNKVSKVIIPNTVTKISDYAFYNCSSLTSITIPDNVANIGGGVFTGCSALATVEWNAKKCQILIDGEGSVYPPFHSIRENITSFVFGSTVETIPEYLSVQMTNLHSVTIPAGVQSIGSYAFYGCSGLDTITNYAATPQTIDSTVFYNVNTTSCVLYVPASSLEAYQAADVWKTFANIRALASDEELGDTDITQFSNVVYFNDLDCRTGSEATLPIQLRNSHPVIGFNFKLYLPEGVSVKSEVDEWDDVVIDAGLSGTRTNASRHTFETALNDEGVLTVLCYSTKNNTFSGNEGEVGYIRLVVDENMEEGTYPLIIREEAISLSDSTPQINYIQSSIHVTRCMAGDANGDNVINVGDITAIASYILENTISGFVSQAADVNGDGFVNVGDITALAQMILNDGNQAPVRFTARGEETEMEAQFAMNVDKVSDNSMNLVVGATNSENAFSAFQFDIVLPEDVQMSDVRLLSRCSYMTFDMTVLDNHRLRVIAYSLDDARVQFMSGELVSIALNGVSSDEFTLTNGIFANGHRTLYVSDVTASYQTPTDIENTSAEKNAEIYDILGRKLNGLQKGIQIVGNQIIFIP